MNYLNGPKLYFKFTFVRFHVDIQIRDVFRCRNVIEYFAKSNKICQLLLRKWSVLDEMKKILHVPYLTTVLLQRNDFTLSDFHGCVQIIELKLKQMIQSTQCKLTGLAQRMLDSMNKRKSKLIDTPLMLSAVFLDPRYKCTIEKEPEKVQLAKMTIEHLWNRLKFLKGEKEQEVPAAKEESMGAFYAELDLHLNESLGLHESSSTDNFNNKSMIINAITKYETSISGFRMKSGESIHAFWESKKTEFGVLYEIASIVFAIPPTQASVERDFSALKYMLTDKRYNLKPELLESLLLIHLNSGFFYQVQSTEIYDKQQSSKNDC